MTEEGCLDVREGVREEIGYKECFCIYYCDDQPFAKSPYLVSVKGRAVHGKGALVPHSLISYRSRSEIRKVSKLFTNLLARTN